MPHTNDFYHSNMHEGRYCVWKLVTDNRMLNNVISLVFKMNRLSLLLKVIDNTIKRIFFSLNCVTEPGQREIYLARIIFKHFFFMKNNCENHWKKELCCTPSIYPCVGAGFSRPSIKTYNTCGKCMMFCINQTSLWW